MKKTVSGILVTGALALACIVGTSAKAEAVVMINFENLNLDGGSISATGGGNFTGSNIVFDSIFLRDNNTTLAGVQCGPSMTVAGASSAAACVLNFNTAANTFSLTTLGGLFNIGPDFQSFTADRGAQVVAAGSNVLTGSFSAFSGVVGGLFVAAGTDTKNAALLSFFGLPNTTFTFANTEIYSTANGSIIDADLSNTAVVPEPASMALFGLGLMGVAAANRRRKANQVK